MARRDTVYITGKGMLLGRVGYKDDMPHIAFLMLSANQTWASALLKCKPGATHEVFE